VLKPGGPEGYSEVGTFDPREAGFVALYKAWKMVKEKTNEAVVVVDADEVLMHPEEMLARYC
jgi:hypothetical protein